ncbi:MAG: hypothetical protein K8I27_13585 [Planctomycetes bacterium]|nr:hypothetical protein [Planctomycetota bacterium]
MNELSVIHPERAAPVSQRRGASRGGDRELVQAAEQVLGHSDFEDVLQLSRRGGLALIHHEGELRVFKFISCQADWKKRWARRIGWNPARRAHRMSRALSDAGILVCPVEQHGTVKLDTAPRAVWTISRYVEYGLTLRQLKEKTQPGRRSPSHPMVQEMFTAAISLLRRLHDAGFEHRDYHAGNLLVTAIKGEEITQGNAQLHLVDLETVMQREVDAVRRSRDLSRFLDNFVEPEDYRQVIDQALADYAPDKPSLLKSILATRRMNGLLAKKGIRDRDREEF